MSAGRAVASSAARLAAVSAAVMPVSRDHGTSRVRPRPSVRRARSTSAETISQPACEGAIATSLMRTGDVALAVDGRAVEQLAEHAQLAGLLLVAAQVEAGAGELDPGRRDRRDAARADEDRLAADRDEQPGEARRRAREHRHDDVVHAPDALARRVVDRQAAQLRREHPHGRITALSSPSRGARPAPRAQRLDHVGQRELVREQRAIDDAARSSSAERGAHVARPVVEASRAA